MNNTQRHKGKELKVSSFEEDLFNSFYKNGGKEVLEKKKFYFDYTPKKHPHLSKGKRVRK